jgi:hypothetical protein
MRKLNIALIALSVLVLVLISFVVYRVFFEFQNSLVAKYINEEASKYGNNTPVTALLTESVQHILKSADLTEQVRKYAEASGLEKERVLVDVALLQCRSFGYIA